MLKLRLLSDADVPVVESWLNSEHVKKFFDVPGVCSIDEWMYEIKNREGDFQFLTHLIAAWDDYPIGFCQYYKCADSDEDWGALPLEGAYCIDYLIGEKSYLGKGLGKEILAKLVERIFSLPNAACVVGDIDTDNKISEKTLLASGFTLFDANHNRYILHKPS